MTALRPERESGASYGQEPYEAYEASGAFEASGASGAFEEWGTDPAGRHGAYAAQEQPYASPPMSRTYRPPSRSSSCRRSTTRRWRCGYRIRRRAAP